MKHTFYITEEKRGSLVPLCVIELAGILVGAFAADYAEKHSILLNYICPELYASSSGEVFLACTAVFGAITAASFIAGAFAFGQPLGILLLLFGGGILGCSGAMMYRSGGISAVPAVLVLFLPKAAAMSAVTVISARELLRNSYALLRCMKDSGEPPQLQLCCIRFLVLIAAVIIFSAIDSLLYHFLGGLL